jgi:hypothetical protein
VDIPSATKATKKPAMFVTALGIHTNKIEIFIGEKVWESKGDVRDIISISKLLREDDGPDEIEQIIKTLTKYGDVERSEGGESD